jgi:hypothetical protein
MLHPIGSTSTAAILSGLATTNIVRARISPLVISLNRTVWTAARKRPGP